MSFFDDDPFDEIVREFFGEKSRPKRNPRTLRSDEDYNINVLEEKDRVHLIFELPGFNESDVAVTVNGTDIEVKAKKSNGENIQEYLVQRLHQGVVLRRNLPSDINTKKFSHTMHNGILEVAFKK